MNKLARLTRCATVVLMTVAFPRATTGQVLEPPAPAGLGKLGPLASRHSREVVGRSRVIVRAVDGISPEALLPSLQAAGGIVHKKLSVINAQVVELPNSVLLALANNPLISNISLDRPVFGAMERSSATIGATAIRQVLGYDGAGVGVAIIDSGVTAWHDDLGTYGAGQRVHQFVDFVNDRTSTYDDYGHGTHVAGIVAGNGFDSGGARSGIAPAAHLIVLKVLDETGAGRISDVIAALDYVVANKTRLDIRIVNLSIATGVYESYNTDPLTIAAKRAVDAGIVVVAAAGNLGRYRDGSDAYGGITAPGNAPWVLTVGASNHGGTSDRADDTMAGFSSRGPTAVDHSAKPDVVAPGVGIESLSDPASAFYTSKSAYLLNGTQPTSYLPYLSLSGSSMAAPVVSGTVALMLQANPNLTPNQVKAILQYTAQNYPNFDPLSQGAGFLNARGAVTLAIAFADPANVYAAPDDWGRRLLWGNHIVSGGRLTPDANAWSADVAWGSETTPAGRTVEWGVICSRGCDGRASWEPWTNANGKSQNAVWGSSCGGADCSGPWTVQGVNTDDDSVVWGTSVVSGTSVVWGTADDDSVVWGTNGDDDDSVVWGTSCTDPSCEPVIWPNP